ncbi:MAG TPA: multicopper oxidase domain-containing protein [Edaphobacter sp.]
MAIAAGSLAQATRAEKAADYTLEIGPCTVEASPRNIIKTIGYNGQVPGPLLRLRENKQTVVEVINHTDNPEIVHWHGLFLPSEIDGAMEQGTPMIPPGQSARYEMLPKPAGFRWYHTHTFAGSDLKRAQYTGQHGFLYIEPFTDPGRYDREEFLALHDWRGHLASSDDGSMNPTYDISTVNSRVLGYGEPIRVKQGQRLLLHVLNSSPTEVHWIALAGHTFQVIALDGNPIPQPTSVTMLRLAPAERVSAIVEMNNPGIWVLGEVRKHVQAAGMGTIIEYEGATGKPTWQQPQQLIWNYRQFATESPSHETSSDIHEIPLVFASKFTGHGSMEQWTINGKSFPNVPQPILQNGQRYRLRLQNHSRDDHPIHLHRHLFTFTQLPGSPTHPRGVDKDTVLVDAGTETVVEFTANDPGLTLLHCHQQNHMDLGFMMLFRYA